MTTFLIIVLLILFFPLVRALLIAAVMVPIFLVGLVVYQFTKDK